MLVVHGYDALSKSFTDEDVCNALYDVASRMKRVDEILQAEKNGPGAVIAVIRSVLTMGMSP
jgi:hypothetical protein